MQQVIGYARLAGAEYRALANGKIQENTQGRWKTIRACPNDGQAILDLGIIVRAVQPYSLSPSANAYTKAVLGTDLKVRERRRLMAAITESKGDADTVCAGFGLSRDTAALLCSLWLAAMAEIQHRWPALATRFAEIG